MRTSNSHWIGSPPLAFALVFAACSLSGCLCTFERDWRAAQQRPVPADNLAGLWEGTWVSHYNGHNGKLRAIITPCGNGRYAAQYKGTFAFIVPFVYETTHTARTEPAVTRFTGREDLGHLAGGVYRINGQANGTTFFARYQADKDHGVFRMRRVGSCGAWDGCAPLGCETADSCPGHASIRVLGDGD